MLFEYYYSMYYYSKLAFILNIIFNKKIDLFNL